MPELISKYKIFVASPSDLVEEREAIDEVVSELNVTYGYHNKIIIELLKWETNSAPAIGNDSVQEIINQDIPKYDLFIGLLWKKFGTATKKYNSGTEEEFFIAYNRFLENPNSIQILFYFKDSLNSLNSLNDLDPIQLMKVMEFKAKLQTLDNASVLYWDFKNKEDLQRFLRMHIPRRIEDLIKRNNLPSGDNVNDSKSVESFEVEIEEEELGVLDYKEIYEEDLRLATLSLDRVANATLWIGEEFEKKTKEATFLLNGINTFSAHDQRSFFARTAKILDEFAIRIEPEINIFSDNFEAGIDAFSKLILIYKDDFKEAYEKERIEAEEALNILLEQINLGIDNLHTFLKTIQNLPRMSKEFNRAKKKVEEKLFRFLEKLELSYSLANESRKNLNNLL